jgi:hypothetical protein
MKIILVMIIYLSFIQVFSATSKTESTLKVCRGNSHDFFKNTVTKFTTSGNAYKVVTTSLDENEKEKIIEEVSGTIFDQSEIEINHLMQEWRLKKNNVYVTVETAFRYKFKESNGRSAMLLILIDDNENMHFLYDVMIMDASTKYLGSDLECN